MGYDPDWDMRCTASTMTTLRCADRFGTGAAAYQETIENY